LEIIQNSKIAGVFLSILLLSSCSVFNKAAKKDKATQNKTEYTPNDKLNSNSFKSAYFDGIKQKSLENWDQALSSFDRCLEMVPGHPATLYQKSLVLTEKSDYEKAVTSIQKAISVEDTNRWYLDHYADLLKRTNDYKKAAETFKKLTELNPGQIRYYYELANMYLYENRVDDALVVYDEIEEKIGFNADIIKQKYKLHSKQGNNKKAEEEVKKLIKNDPTNANYRGMLASLYRSQGEYEKAIETFKKLRDLDPENPLIALSLADYYEDAGKDDLAFEERKKAFANPELDIDSKVKILLNYYRVSDPGDQLAQKSLELLSILEKSHPDEAKTFAIYGDFLIREGSSEKAREKYIKSIALDSSRFLVWNQLLIIESELNKTESLEEHSAAAMELFPSQPISFLMNGLSNLQLENYDKAAFALEQGKNLVVDNQSLQTQFYSSLGDAYYNLEKYEKAWLNYENAIKLNPKNDYVLNNYAYFLSLRKENLDKAKEMASQTVKRHPTNPTYLDTYAWVLYQKGEYQKAKTHLETALENGGMSQGEILEHYGDVLNKLGQKEAARKYWKKAKDTGAASDQIDQKLTQSAQ
jgi:tetratricopeptide (TPR) repeat protein